MAMSDRHIVARSMRSRWLSTALTALSVAVAVALMLVLVSITQSARKLFERGSGNMHLLVSGPGQDGLVSVLASVFHAGVPDRPLPWSLVLRLQRDPRIAWAVPSQMGDSYQGFPVVGTTADFFTRFSVDTFTGSGQATSEIARPLWALEQGRLFERPFELVLGAQVARATGLRVDDSIALTHGYAGGRAVTPHVHAEFQFKVVGVLERTSTPHDRALFTDLVGSWVLHAHDRRLAADPRASITTVDDITEDDRVVTGVYVRMLTRAGREASAVLPEVAAALRADPRMTVASPATEIGNLFELIGGLDIVLRSMAGVVMVSSGIGIMLALYNSMDQRRRQVAVLRVLGSSRSRVMRLVLAEATAIGAIGAVAGVALAILGMGLVASVLRMWTGVVIQPSINPTAVGLIALGALVVSAVSGLVPALMAYRTSVANNLRPIA